MECPNCNVEMKELYARIKWNSPFGKSKGTLKHKTKAKRVFHCLKCRKYFSALLTLIEVELA